MESWSIDPKRGRTCRYNCSVSFPPRSSGRSAGSVWDIISCYFHFISGPVEPPEIGSHWPLLSPHCFVTLFQPLHGNFTKTNQGKDNEMIETTETIKGSILEPFEGRRLFENNGDWSQRLFSLDNESNQIYLAIARLVLIRSDTMAIWEILKSGF